MALIEIENSFFQLFSCCIPVKGAKRSIVCDLQRQDFIYIPNILHDLFSDSKSSINIEEASIIFNQSEDLIEFSLEEILNMMVQKEYGFFSTNPLNFPGLSPDIASPGLISNAIIDIQYKVVFDLEKFITELTDCACQSVLIRIFGGISKKEIEHILGQFENSTIRSIEIIMPYNQVNNTKAKIKQLFSRYPRCQRVTIYGCKNVNRYYKENSFDIIFTEFAITSDNCCGHVSPYYFRVNNPFFFEAKKSNSCLNKKISVDINGLIKNCPSFKNDFGHYNTIHSLEAVIQNDQFNQVWGIAKDEINICKDCEFRYICHDCRAFTQDNSLISKPLKCNYNPYEAIWE